MDMWMKVLWAVVLGAMIVALLPHAKTMLANSRKASNQEWTSVLVPLLFVAGLVLLLIVAVRS